ncbi:hypothetical protein HT136_17445 [Novosphingobium profundi]|uniref:hypothetical protein n=1 Tax=Novosphingobium profundi TaxID=1774954 RepID=UPI001BD94D47|nr:hypothetical protein [Novosphingobium profundi]MBT0670154.1 hypothetical protein [Novosphingobium profundi]
MNSHFAISRRAGQKIGLAETLHSKRSRHVAARRPASGPWRVHGAGVALRRSASREGTVYLGLLYALPLALGMWIPLVLAASHFVR